MKSLYNKCSKNQGTFLSLGGYMDLFGKTYEKKDLIYMLVAFLVFLAPLLYSLLHLSGVAPLFFWLILLVLALKSFHLDKIYKSDIFNAVYSSVFTFLHCQLLMFYGVPAMRAYLNGFLFTPLFLRLYDFSVLLTSLLLFSGIYLFFRLVRVPGKIAACLVPVLFILMITADFFVYSARGHELIAVDVLNASTAATVAGNYHYDVLHVIMYGICPYILFVLGIVRQDTKDCKKSAPKKDLLTMAAAFVITCLATVLSFGFFRANHTILTYQFKASGSNTFILNFLYSSELLFPDKPDNYSLDYINDESAKLLNSSSQIDPSWMNDDVNIVVIMNEAYADMSIYQDQFDSYIEPAPFYQELINDPNCISGYYLASVFGGNTANSEFEFLCSLPLAFEKDGTVPYSTAIRRDMQSLPNYLRDIGYTTIAMHPNAGTNWRRNTVYPLLGFDDQFFIDDITYTADDLIRNQSSDLYNYRFLTERITERHSAGQNKVFYFLVTMQNHSGYSDCNAYANFQPDTYVTSSKTPAPCNMDELNGYMSLVHESDLALEYLIEWMREQDEKYLVFFFGDHQPGVTGLLDMAEYPQQSYEVPFFLWTNYDLPEEIREDLESHLTQTPDTRANLSLNYCALDVLEASAIPFSDYYRVIDAVRPEVPIIDSKWYYDMSQQAFCPASECIKRYPSMHLYSCIEYDVLYDKKQSNVTDK